MKLQKLITENSLRRELKNMERSIISYVVEIVVTNTHE